MNKCSPSYEMKMSYMILKLIRCEIELQSFYNIQYQNFKSLNKNGSKLKEEKELNLDEIDRFKNSKEDEEISR